MLDKTKRFTPTINKAPNKKASPTLHSGARLLYKILIALYKNRLPFQPSEHLRVPDLGLHLCAPEPLSRYRFGLAPMRPRAAFAFPIWACIYAPPSRLQAPDLVLHLCAPSRYCIPDLGLCASDHLYVLVSFLITGFAFVMISL